MFGTWTDSLKSLQTCAQEFDYTEDLHTLSRYNGPQPIQCSWTKKSEDVLNQCVNFRTRPRSLKVWLWEGSYSVTTETCRVMLSWKNKICSLYVQYKVSTVTYSDSLLITANYETSATRCQVWHEEEWEFSIYRWCANTGLSWFSFEWAKASFRISVVGFV